MEVIPSATTILVTDSDCSGVAARSQAPVPDIVNVPVSASNSVVQLSVASVSDVVSDAITDPGCDVSISAAVIMAAVMRLIYFFILFPPCLHFNS